MFHVFTPPSHSLLKTSENIEMLSGDIEMEQWPETTQKMKFSIKDFFSVLRIWSHLLEKSLMENFVFCAV